MLKPFMFCLIFSMNAFTKDSKNNPTEELKKITEKYKADKEDVKIESDYMKTINGFIFSASSLQNDQLIQLVSPLKLSQEEKAKLVENFVNKINAGAKDAQKKFEGIDVKKVQELVGKYAGLMNANSSVSEECLATGDKLDYIKKIDGLINGRAMDMFYSSMESFATELKPVVKNKKMFESFLGGRTDFQKKVFNKFCNGLATNSVTDLKTAYNDLNDPNMKKYTEASTERAEEVISIAKAVFLPAMKKAWPTL